MPPIRKPRKVVKPNGKKARQMLMGLALGWHVMSKTMTKVQFMIKSHMEAQVLFMLMAPFLAIPAVILSVPALCLCLSAMVAAGVSSNMTRFTAVQHMMDRHQFVRLGKKSALFEGLDGPSSGGVRLFQRTHSAPQGIVSRTRLAPRSRGLPMRSKTFTFGG